MNTAWKVITRKKLLGPNVTTETRLARILNTFDLTALGVGSTLGVGVYVLAGHIAKDIAGPSVILSFLLAAIASVFAGLCYAEFGARVPKAGSAYIYSYVCIGELTAFIIGWNLILEYVIGSASVARGLSLYLDTMLNNTLNHTFTDIAPIGVDFMSPYFDFLAFGISVLLAVGLAFGLKESSSVNNVFTILNVAVVVFVVVAGSIKSNGENWQVPANATSPAIGNGGFFPFGVTGMIKGAATCFYGFVGFDCIATTGEEVRNPQKAIPLSIVLSLTVIFLAYFGTSTVITLMVPYYLQDPDAPIPHAFEMIGWNFAKWIVAVGGVFGLCSSLFGAMFPLPRIIFAMASDGLVFRFLGAVSQRHQTPVVGTIFAGILTGLMAALFNLAELISMMSIGTLLAYTIVAACVLLLRYSVDEPTDYSMLPSSSDSENEAYINNKTNHEPELSETIQNQPALDDDVTLSTVGKQFFNSGKFENPSKISEKLVVLEIFIFCILCLLMGLCGLHLVDEIARGEVWAITLTSIIGLLLIIILMSLTAQPTSKKVLSFKVPLVPLVPAVSILFNVYLMLMLDVNTWIRFAVWMIIGIPIYFFSVRLYPKTARNTKVKTNVDKTPNGNVVTNGTKSYINHAYAHNETGKAQNGNMSNGNAIKTNPDPPIVTLSEPENNPSKNVSPIELDLALAALDDVLCEDNWETISVDSISLASNVNNEQNVVALVHREDTVSAPVTPKMEVSSLHSKANVVRNGQYLSPHDNTKLKLNDNKIDEIQILNDTENSDFNINKVNDINDQNVDKIYEIPLEMNKNNVDNLEEIENIIPVAESVKNNSNDNNLSTETDDVKELNDNNIEFLIKNDNSVEDMRDITKDDRHLNDNMVVSSENDNIVKEKLADEINDNRKTEQEVIIEIENRDELVSFPPPPPLPLSDLFDKVIVPRIPRIVPGLNELNEVKLKPVKERNNAPDIPPVDYADEDKHLVFGTQEHSDFKTKLNNIMRLGSVVSPRTPATATPKDKNKTLFFADKDAVITDEVRIKEAREKLGDFLAKGQRYMQIFSPGGGRFDGKPANVENEVENTDLENEGKNEIEKNEIEKSDISPEMAHRQRMMNTLKSIKLRKVDSIKNDINRDH